MNNPYKRANTRRLRNNDRQRLIRAQIVKPQHDGPSERKTIERQWEQALKLSRDYIGEKT